MTHNGSSNGAQNGTTLQKILFGVTSTMLALILSMGAYYITKNDQKINDLERKIQQINDKMNEERQESRERLVRIETKLDAIIAVGK